jgi:hypothetical protein
MPPNTVKVDRSTKWGNPFRKGGSDENVVDAFRRYLENARTVDAHEFANAVRAELRGKNLACWCPLDAPCHADVLLEVANS